MIFNSVIAGGEKSKTKVLSGTKSQMSGRTTFTIPGLDFTTITGLVLTYAGTAHTDKVLCVEYSEVIAKNHYVYCFENASSSIEVKSGECSKGSAPLKWSYSGGTITFTASGDITSDGATFGYGTYYWTVWGE